MEYECGPNEKISLAVVRAVSTVVDRDAPDLRPLAEILDTDALDALFSPRTDGTFRIGGEVSFVYSGCRVSVQNGEYVTVHRLDPDRASRR
ncbi:hypothetical protein GJ629_01940 [Halapricum sp. CBA1109]|uniref:HalOD1 output domain-containing protein n=1 Tax=Halapricum sp. CBA1109 TaxID=2668068 RepID=UPI0012F7ABE6|nr:HalOD1 output domain-containing protein [Halapricum sp. CBA1109]MUV88800.1 hypothetical protein [Halapricum sp. CBA1109]